MKYQYVTFFDIKPNDLEKHLNNIPNNFEVFQILPVVTKEIFVTYTIIFRKELEGMSY